MPGGHRGGTYRGQLHIISRQMEAVVRVISFDKGSKRRIKLIRWNAREIISVVVLSLIVLALGVLLGLWEVSHYSAEPKTPHVKAMP